MNILDFSRRVARNVWRVPVLSSVLERDYERAFFSGRGRYRGVYSSFAEARAAIPASEKIGFDHAALAAMYRERMVKACASDYGVLFWLQRILQVDSFLFDFGGHVGISYHGWRSYLDYPPGLRWVVYDLPAITRVGEELAREKASPGLSFTNRLTDAKGCSIFLAAGSVQFLDQSLPSLLDEGGARPRHLIVNKLPVYDGKPFVTIQSAGNAFHPYQIYNRQQFLAEVQALGYRLIDEWMNADLTCIIPYTRDRNIEAYSGFYFLLDR